MSRRLLLVNVVVGGLGCLFAVGIVHDVIRSRSLPPAPVLRPSQSTPEPTGQPAPPVPFGAYQVIATKSMFNPGRSDATEAAAAAATTAGPRPILHGVLIDGDRSRAYLEEPPAREVFGYAVGDRVAGGRLDSIETDRVVILRPEGRLVVLLQDPSKPRPAAGGGPSPAGARGRAYPGFSRVPPPSPPPPPNPGQPGNPPQPQ
ncbi:MAG TPA: hypothetical protein VJU81_03250 [Methylomirabilota bacterium]|nr:hypothetical protein [Methylomirabilota bacterium]